MFDHHPVHDAAVRHHVDRLLPLEDEQRAWFHHVPAVLRFRGRLIDVRVRDHRLSLLSSA